MRFDVEASLIRVHDNRPGQHATLFGPDGKARPFRPADSAFNDRNSKYMWAFEGSARDGDRLVFATADREAVFIVGVPGTTQPPVGEAVERDGDKPVRLRFVAPPPKRIMSWLPAERPAIEPRWPPPVLARDLP